MLAPACRCLLERSKARSRGPMRLFLAPGPICEPQNPALSALWARPGAYVLTGTLGPGAASTVVVCILPRPLVGWLGGLLALHHSL